jgi:hypothetical protein
MLIIIIPEEMSVCSENVCVYFIRLERNRVMIR